MSMVTNGFDSVTLKSLRGKTLRNSLNTRGQRLEWKVGERGRTHRKLGYGGIPKSDFNPFDCFQGRTTDVEE